ncbi:MAG: hemerythrin domain-containing protein [Pseudomonadota bacterium]
MNAIELLIKQHRSLEALLSQTLKEKNKENITQLFSKAGDELTVHIASEEQVFYPAVKNVRTEDILLESLEEHLSLKRLLADLVALNPEETTFEPKLKVLTEQAEHHHKEEEEHLFPKVKKLLNAEQLDALGEEMMNLQKSLIQQGSARKKVVGETTEAFSL